MPEIPAAPAYNLTQVDVCNNAFGMVGLSGIGALDEQNANGYAACARRQFPSVLSAMLRDHDWNFATRRVYLPQIDPDVVAQFLTGFGTGGFGGGGFGGGSGTTVEIAEPKGFYTFWYALPNNYLRAWQINNDDDQKFSLEFGTLQTNSSPVQLRYTAYIDDPNLWDALFRLGMETLLASRFAGELNGNLGQAAALRDDALGNPGRGIVGIFSQAKAVVGQEGSVYAYTSSDLTTDIREM